MEIQTLVAMVTIVWGHVIVEQVVWCLKMLALVRIPVRFQWQRNRLEEIFARTLEYPKMDGV